MNDYDDMRTNYRTEYGVRMACYAKRGGYTEIVAVGDGYTDRASVFDHIAPCADALAGELRNALRRHARAVKRERDH